MSFRYSNEHFKALLIIIISTFSVIPGHPGSERPASSPGNLSWHGLRSLLARRHNTLDFATEGGQAERIPLRLPNRQGEGSHVSAIRIRGPVREGREEPGCHSD